MRSGGGLCVRAMTNVLSRKSSLLLPKSQFLMKTFGSNRASSPFTESQDGEGSYPGSQVIGIPDALI